MTAFDDFEYARKCVSLPVFEYMLKPIVKEEVMETLRRVKERLDEKKAETGVLAEGENDEDLFEEGTASDQIIKYIEENYKDPQLNLTATAQHFGFSSSYLSRKFKGETGKNFVEYLTDCRMKKAIELAAKNVKMYKAAEEVGIPDPNYFGKCFKKYAGVSYSEYAK